MSTRLRPAPIARSAFAGFCYYTAAARLEADGRVPESLVQSVAALLFGLPATTVIAHISKERSSRHRACHDAEDHYGRLLAQRSSHETATADARAAWERAWLRAVELQAEVKAEIATAMIKEYPRFERLVLLARSKVDRAPLYQGAATLPVAPDWKESMSSDGPLRSPHGSGGTDSLAPILEALEHLRPPARTSR